MKIPHDPGQVPQLEGPVGVASTSLLMRTLIAMLALEWQLCSEDPVIFCYRIGVGPARVFFGKFAARG
jgi:hypothetical protein